MKLASATPLSALAGAETEASGSIGVEKVRSSKENLLCMISWIDKNPGPKSLVFPDEATRKKSRLSDVWALMI